ncbi:MAG: tRNA pseudouridine(55) synthase TruB [Ruminococcus sp.]|nr:tRNA pseudouridine(55) synthase TruB [Ruminococcus sp.]
MNGILCVNKPQGFTSFDVIAKLRGIMRIRRLGHGGTLDPMATGVLPVFVGASTKACDIMPDSTKSYTAGFVFGLTSDTQDVTGTVLTRSDIPVERAQIEAMLPALTGKIMQLPPMYSAVQVNGKRLYDLARQGIEVEREPREVEITQLSLGDYDPAQRTGTLSISCSKGTYIRTIISDIGEKLGCGGIMTSLVRTSSSGFMLDDCYTLDQIQQAADSGELEAMIKPTDRVFSAYPELRLGEAQTRMYRSGVKLDLARVRGVRSDSDIYRVYADNGDFIGLARADRDEGVLRVRKNLR